MLYSDFPAWHNGEFCATGDVKISAADLGLLRSYGVYEVITVKKSRILGLNQHLDRFFAGCRHYYINLPYTKDQLIAAIQQLHNKVLQDLHVWLIATRGESVSYDLRDILKAPPHVIMLTGPYMEVNHGRPMKLGISKRVRRIPDQSIDQRYKNFARQDFTVAQIETAMQGFDNPLLLDYDGFITEGPQFSVAVIKDHKVMSPARNRLSGVTMELVRDFCDQNNIEFEYCNIDQSLLNTADDMFATTTAGGIISAKSVDSKIFIESELQQQIKSWYQQAWVLNSIEL